MIEPDRLKKTRHPGIWEVTDQRRTYWIRVKATSPLTGKEKEVTRLLEDVTLADAYTERVRLRDEIRAGRVEARTMTLGEFAGPWLERKIHGLSEATVDKYANDLRKHILPARHAVKAEPGQPPSPPAWDGPLGDVFLHMLRPSMIGAFVGQDVKRHPSGHAPLNRLRLLRQISADAVAEGLTEMDFCARVKPPAVSDYDEDENPNRLLAPQLDSLLTVLQTLEPRWYTLVLALATTGMRWSEVSALRWEDIDETDPETPQIRVRRRNYRGSAGRTKTKGSRRNVPLACELAERLRELRRQMVEQQDPSLVEGWIFPVTRGQRRGQLHRGCPLHKVLRRLLPKAKITIRLTPHGLRRTLNDLLDRVARDEVAKRIIGHTTDRMHSHYSMADRAEKAEAVANVVELVRSTGTRPDPARGRAESRAGGGTQGGTRSTGGGVTSGGATQI